VNPEEDAMGAWGPGHFENDAALDWLAGLEDERGLRRALVAVAEAPADAYLEVDACSEALAAAEVAAACGGRPGDDLPAAVGYFAERHPGIAAGDLLDLARGAVKRVGAASELQELWDEGARNEAWHAAVDWLAERLDPPR
jgi:hypothetical protein